MAKRRKIKKSVFCKKMIDENRSNQDNTPRKADKVKQMMAT